MSPLLGAIVAACVLVLLVTIFFDAREIKKLRNQNILLRQKWVDCQAARFRDRDNPRALAKAILGRAE